MKTKRIFRQNCSVLSRFSLLALIAFFIQVELVAQEDKSKNRMVWPASDNSKLNPIQINYLLNQCLNNVFLSNDPHLIQENGLYSLPHHIDNNYAENVFLTFDLGNDQDILGIYEINHYVDFKYTQNIADNLNNFSPALQVPIQYLEDGMTRLLQKKHLNHIGHIQISNLYLYRDEINVLFKIKMKTSESPNAFEDTRVLRFYAKRCDTGEIILYQMDSDYMYLNTFPQRPSPQAPVSISPKFNCWSYGPSIQNGRFLRKRDIY